MDVTAFLDCRTHESIVVVVVVVFVVVVVVVVVVYGAK